MEPSQRSPGLLGDLEQLDPFAFWIIPGEAYGVDFAVLGITGGFVVICRDQDGYVKTGMGKVMADGERIQGFSKARRAARLLEEKINAMTLAIPPVEAFVCFRRATVGQPRKYKDVWMANPPDMRKMMVERPAALSHKQAKAYAEKLGAIKNPNVGVRPDVEQPEAEEVTHSDLEGLESLGGLGDFI